MPSDCARLTARRAVTAAMDVIRNDPHVAPRRRHTSGSAMFLASGGVDAQCHAGGVRRLGPCSDVDAQERVGDLTDALPMVWDITIKMLGNSTYAKNMD